MVVNSLKWVVGGQLLVELCSFVLTPCLLLPHPVRIMHQIPVAIVVLILYAAATHVK
jgi:hypothetical protein